MAAALSLLLVHGTSLYNEGFLYAIASGAFASGIGYAIWYTALPVLNATRAATVQLSVPVIAALGGIIFLGETLSLRLGITSIAILGGIALVILKNREPAPAQQRLDPNHAEDITKRN